MSSFDVRFAVTDLVATLATRRLMPKIDVEFCIDRIDAAHAKLRGWPKEAVFEREMLGIYRDVIGPRVPCAADDIA